MFFTLLSFTVEIAMCSNDILNITELYLLLANIANLGLINPLPPEFFFSLFSGHSLR